ncbi:TraR/DksA C4-type zinc finger protein [Natribacillus halophilus]|uniref:RNA polymerase-binding transcription factor DksA n=1 Tax=Natribacillus halophilus TaxID=549003 RepID=A0A1G8MFZ3_9BACI|nr:TraR/DksA C4-type zinc finger protein [Natribacillus halophilus]SDI66836.1 RNA polymerase-binding transcription factor DksA [Natribacillus halophilus]
MTDKEAAIQWLYERRSELENQVAIKNQDSRDNELSVYDNHPADSADIFYEASKDKALRNHRNHEYAEVMHALDKVRQGTYGVCEATGEQISAERLRAHPAARTQSQNRGADGGPHFFVDPPSNEASPSANHEMYVNGDGALDGTDMWEALMNTTEDDGYRETATTDFWVEQAPGYTEDMERFLSTGIEGFTGNDHVGFSRNEDYYALMDEEENGRL